MRIRTRARRVDPPPSSASRHELGSLDYVSAFAIENTHPRWTSEQWARAVWEGAPAIVQVGLRLGWRIFLRLPVAERHLPDHILGWQFTEHGPGELNLESKSPLIGAQNRVLVDTGEVRWVTYVHFNSVLARLVWTVIAPVHHAFIPRALEHAARTG